MTTLLCLVPQKPLLQQALQLARGPGWRLLALELPPVLVPWLAQLQAMERATTVEVLSLESAHEQVAGVGLDQELGPPRGHESTLLVRAALEVMTLQLLLLP